MGVLCCHFRPKMFSPGDHVRYHSRTLGAHVLATVVGPSPNGTQFCHIRYIRPGGVTPVDHESAQVSRLEAVAVESPKSPESPDVTPMSPMLLSFMLYMYVSPPNTTPYSQGCDKVQINQSFGRDIEEQFCAWLLPILEKLSDKDPVPSPERRLMVTWIRDAWERISDEKILRATEMAYFPKGMKLSELEDTEYFSRTHDDSPTESESESSDSSSSGSTSSDESRQEDSDVDSMSSSSEEEEEEEEEEEGNDVEVVWAKSARGVWGLGHVFDGKLYFTRDICEEKWIPKDLVPPKKSVAAPKARGKAAPQPRGKPAGLAVQAGAKAAAKPAPSAIASSSSASATHPVPVMQTEHVQQFKVCYSRTQKFFTVPLDPQ